MKTFISNSEQETEEIGARFAADLPAGSVARGMGIDAHVSSPTFTIVNEYPGPRELIHFDMYRLSSPDELFDIGWEDYLSRGAVCAVEWSENVRDAFYGDEITVTIEKTGDTERRITIC